MPLSRRRFLQKSTATGLALSLWPISQGEAAQAPPASAPTPPVAPPLTLGGEQAGWRAGIDPDYGTLRTLQFRRDGQWDAVLFRTDRFAGPSWEGVTLAPQDAAGLTFAGRSGDVVYTLRYQGLGGRFAITAGLHNVGAASFAPKQARLRLGVDTEMTGYPQWDTVLFPTLMRCEKTHFWGYFMGPTGRILGIASPDPIAAYHLEYNGLGHHIYTASLDLLHAPPLPARHPQNVAALAPGEQRFWTIFLEDVPNLDALKPALAGLARAPMIELDRYTLAEGEASGATFWSDAPVHVSLTPPASPGRPPVSHALVARPGKAAGTWRVTLPPAAGPGVYTLAAVGADGRRSDALLSVRRPWSWYLKRARIEALNKPQKASDHRESWTGCFSTYLARLYFPDPALDAAGETMFRALLGAMYDTETATPKAASKPGRSQNHSVMFSLLSLVYATEGRTEDLDLASRLADWLIANRQADDGSYRANSKTGVYYTSVHYMAKNMLEVAAEEKTLAGGSPAWRDRYARHYESARRAIDDLLKRGDRIETEGEQTLEDSMIANTASQLALFALLQTDPAARDRYTQGARRMDDEHRCLSQLLIPDCRMRGGTLRFWESQYDVLTKPDMMNSPHGWTGRKTPGTWYLYLLTGEERFLRDTMDAVGACMQLIDGDSGELRWGFVPDPYIEADVFEQDPAQPGMGVSVKRVVGEQYLPMISGWWKAPPGVPVRGYSTTIPGSCCDNDVHEVFKAMAEIALTAAYVLERTDGTLQTWNCTARRDGGTLAVVPAESVVSRVHLNLKKKQAVRVHFADGADVRGAFAGLQWVGPGGLPELLRCGPDVEVLHA